MISILRKRYPIVMWTKEGSIEAVTFGWCDFHEKLSDINVKKNDLPEEWEEKYQDNSDDVIRYMSEGRKNYSVNDYTITDGINYLHGLLAEKWISREKTIHGLPSEDFYCLTLEHKSNLPKLYFTAPKVYRENIMEGIQPMRWNTFYSRHESDEDNLTFDRTEGLHKRTTIKNIDIEKSSLRRGSILRDNAIIDKHFDALIFCLHDDQISKNEKERFGEDTYEIVNFYEWVDSIINDVHSNLHLLAGSTDLANDYIGVYCYFDECKYEDTKDTKTENASFDDLGHTFRFFPRSGFVQMVGCTIDSKGYQRPKDMHKALRNDFYIKPEKYKGQSEWRLVIIPVCADEHKCWFMPSPRLNDEIFSNSLHGHELKNV